MLDRLRRQSAQLLNDPILRHWLWRRVRRKTNGVAPFRPGRPPYITSALDYSAHSKVRVTLGCAAGVPEGAITLYLPGKDLQLEPGADQIARVLADRANDLETFLAVQRFSWLPLCGASIDPKWVNALWTEWMRQFAAKQEGWPWHPYTAAERAINVMTFAERFGYPGNSSRTADLLVEHGAHIARNLEYFGEHNTSNHLANDGRGLLAIGQTFGISPFMELGLLIMLEEAKRIFLPSGVLREGSSHYHYLVTSWYVDAWLRARAAQRREAADLEAITRRAIAVCGQLALPGRLPLIGDISPDCPPDFLRPLAPAESITENDWGWWLNEVDRQAFFELRETAEPPRADRLERDGWLRAEGGPWVALWHASPAGWPPMPGHGHQDIGGFELHFGSEVLFCDLGRRSYGEIGAPDLRACAHNSLLVDGEDPYPKNRPYYDDSFRRDIGGPPPSLRQTDGGVELVHFGYSRFETVGALRRRWRLENDRVAISDAVDGKGLHRVSRFLHTSFQVVPSAQAVILKRGTRSFRLQATGRISIRPSMEWHAYLRGRPATTIEIVDDVMLPWESSLEVTCL